MCRFLSRHKFLSSGVSIKECEPWIVRSCQTVFQRSCFSPAVNEFLWIHFSPAFLFVSVLDFGCSDRCVPYCCFNLHICLEHLFMDLFAICMFSLVRCLIRFLAHLNVRFFVFLLLTFSIFCIFCFVLSVIKV
jgi:hypothetical protein